MTIKEIARKRGITTQAVYQKIKAAGLDISDLREENSAKLSEKGIAAVEKLFTNQKEKETQAIKRANELEIKVKSLEDELITLEKRLQEAREDRDRWAEQAKAAQQTAQQAQALNLATLQRITAPEEKESERRSFWARLTGKK